MPNASNPAFNSRGCGPRTAFFHIQDFQLFELQLPKLMWKDDRLHPSKKLGVNHNWFFRATSFYTRNIYTQQLCARVVQNLWRWLPKPLPGDEFCWPVLLTSAMHLFLHFRPGACLFMFVLIVYLSHDVTSINGLLTYLLTYVRKYFTFFWSHGGQMTTLDTISRRWIHDCQRSLWRPCF